MQVFIIGTVYETAAALDARRLNKQILEADWIIKSHTGEMKPKNHPVYKSYADHLTWLGAYKSCLECYRAKQYDLAKDFSDTCEICKPSWHKKDFFDQMKRRLYTKDNNHYRQWSHLGETDVNYYYVNGELWKYKVGKGRIYDDN